MNIKKLLFSGQFISIMLFILLTGANLFLYNNYAIFGRYIVFDRFVSFGNIGHRLPTGLFLVIEPKYTPMHPRYYWSHPSFPLQVSKGDFIDLCEGNGVFAHFDQTILSVKPLGTDRIMPNSWEVIAIAEGRKIVYDSNSWEIQTLRNDK